MTRAAGLLAGLLLLMPGTPVLGHSFDPALLVLREREPGQFDVAWRTSPARIPLGRTIADDPLVPVLPARCRRVYPAEPPASEPGVPVFWRVVCTGGLRGERLASTGADPSPTDVVVRVDWLDGPPFTGVLRRDAPALELPREVGAAFGSSAGTLAWGYLLLGVRHILEGVDHLLFVLGLFLLVHSTGELVRTITAFTVAHSLSLALATLGVVTLPSRPVEALIAASIVLVAREVARGPGAEPTLAGERPWVVAFAFGLLHGLGFAGALAEIGLPRAHAALALLAFNAGVEVGQLVFVAVLFLVAIPFRAVVRQPPRLRLLPAYAMGTVAVVWVIERVRAFWSLTT
jgi:hypothetical protein